jgi:two-component system, LytTR family, sensor kinase
MEPQGLRTSRLIALAVVVGAFFTVQEVTMDLARGHQVNTLQDVVEGLEFWLVWAMLTPAVLAAVRRWPLDAKPIHRPLALHASIAVALATLHNIIALGLQSLVARFGDAFIGGLKPSFGATASRPVRCVVEMPWIDGRFHPVWSANCISQTAFVWGVFTGVTFYAVVVMVYTALRFRSSAAALEAELTRSKLDTLRSQLRPHFLFNTLNAIFGLIAEDTAKAQQMLLRLSTLLRRSLDEEAHEVPLCTELGFVNDYLDIQRGRFGDQLTVQLAIDPSVLNARVPVFLLQPLMENAIEHGSTDNGCSRVVLCASRDGDMLRVTLEDDGPGLSVSDPVHEWIGLRNTRARLQHLYGSHASVDLAAATSSMASPGARVEIRIPFASVSG